MNRTLTAAAACALALHFWLGFSFIRASSASYDEPVHLASGYAGLATGEHFLNSLDHPPLAETAAALPLLAYGPDIFPAELGAAAKAPYHSRLYAYADLFLNRNTVPAEKLLNAARYFSLFLWSLLGAAAVFLLARELRSPAAGVLAAAALLLNPAVISNNALAGTDAAPAVFYAWAALFGLLSAGRERPPGRRLLYAALAGAAAGCAMASKFSMFIAGPLVPALWLADWLASGRKEPRALLLRAALFAAAALLALAAAYNFSPGQYWDGLAATLGKLGAGRPSFAAGVYPSNGAWWYFPFVLAVKTPLLLLAAWAAGAVLCARYFSLKWLWLAGPLLAYFLPAMNSGLLLGVRHVLPAVYLLSALGGTGLAWLLEKRAWRPALAVLAALLAFGLARVHPHYLAYFNEPAGGPAGGWRLLADSNLDWGQGVKALARELEKRGSPPVVLAYFGTARPENYGIKYFPLATVSNIRLEGSGADACAMDPVLLAVSATNLQGVYYSRRDAFAWLKKEKPAFTAGYSIFVYEVSGNGLEKLAGVFDLSGLRREAACLRARAAGSTTTPPPAAK